jgi:FkbM family methyltransferase
MSERPALIEALVRARQNSWLRSLGRSILRLPGAGAVLRRFMNQVSPRGRRVWFQIRAGAAQGLWLRVEPYLEERYLSGCPEPSVQNEMLRHLGSGGCFYDVGAHIGFYSLLAARLVGGGGHVVAFEPDPANVAVLQENVLRNDVSHVDVIAAAVWSHGGVVKFRRTEHPEMSSRRGAVLAPNGNRFGPGLIEVEAVTLDTFAENHRLPTVIKIDVEGAEVEVLTGAQQLVSQTRPILIVEVHHQQAATALEEQLRQKDYVVDWRAAHPEFPFPRYLLAWPKEGCSH